MFHGTDRIIRAKRSIDRLLFSRVFRQIVFASFLLFIPDFPYDYH